LGRPASAQPDDPQAAEARRLYNEARQAFKQERYREAALSFEAASKIRPHAVALYTAAQAWELAGEPARAADAYARALSTPKLEDEQTARARERLEALEAELATVVVAGPDGTRVMLDDHVQLAVPARLHATPGDHTLSIEQPGGAGERRALKLEKGVLEIDLQKAESKEAAASPPPKTAPVVLAEPRKVAIKVEEPRSPWLTVGWAATGAGLAALGGAVLLGMSAEDAEESFKASPTRESFDHAKALETRTNVMLVVGGVLTAGGVALVVYESSKPKEQIALKGTIGGIFAEGRF
jgi:hypothetical protein